MEFHNALQMTSDLSLIGAALYRSQYTWRHDLRLAVRPLVTYSRSQGQHQNRTRFYLPGESIAERTEVVSAHMNAI